MIQNLMCDTQRSIGTIYRNLAFWGFKKSMIAYFQLQLLNQTFNLELDYPVDGRLRPSQYVKIMQEIYKLYGWGKYDDEEEIVWLKNKIKSQEFLDYVLNVYGNCDYLQWVDLIRLHKQAFNLRIKDMEL